MRARRLRLRSYLNSDHIGIYIGVAVIAVILWYREDRRVNLCASLSENQEEYELCLTKCR